MELDALEVLLGLPDRELSAAPSLPGSTLLPLLLPALEFLPELLPPVVLEQLLVGGEPVLGGQLEGT